MKELRELELVKCLGLDQEDANHIAMIIVEAYREGWGDCRDFYNQAYTTEDSRQLAQHIHNSYTQEMLMLLGLKYRQLIPKF